MTSDVSESPSQLTPARNVFQRISGYARYLWSVMPFLIPAWLALEKHMSPPFVCKVVTTTKDTKSHVVSVRNCRWAGATARLELIIGEPYDMSRADGGLDYSAKNAETKVEPDSKAKSTRLIVSPRGTLGAGGSFGVELRTATQALVEILAYDEGANPVQIHDGAAVIESYSKQLAAVFILSLVASGSVVASMFYSAKAGNSDCEFQRCSASLETIQTLYKESQAKLEEAQLSLARMQAKQESATDDEVFSGTEKILDALRDQLNVTDFKNAIKKPPVQKRKKAADSDVSQPQSTKPN